MQNKEKSFWDEPEWLKKWKHSRLCGMITVAAYIGVAILTYLHGTHAMFYAAVSPISIIVTAYVIGWAFFKDRSFAPSCLSIMIAVPVVGFLGYAIFKRQILRFDRPTPFNPLGLSLGQALIAASIAMTIWLTIMYIHRDDSESE